jgi:hypothetical protein
MNIRIDNTFSSSEKHFIRYTTLDKEFIRPFLIILFPFKFAVADKVSRSYVMLCYGMLCRSMDHERPDHPVCCNIGPVTIQARYTTVPLPAQVR